MAADASAGGSKRHPVVLDLTRIDNLNDAKRIFLSIRNEDNVSVLVDSDPVSDYNFDSQNAYNLYGYTPIDFGGNTFINYSIDLARMNRTYLNKGDKNRYSNYKYAYHYPIPKSNWNKFSRFKLNYPEYTILPRINTNDFYSFLSIFDSTNQYMYGIFMELNNSNYKDFIDSNPNSNEYIGDKPIQYHGRNIYMDKKFIYLKINDAMDLYKLSNVVACKYMVIELDGSNKRPVTLDGAFSLCNTHAYIINTSTNKLDLKLTGLLRNCKATKFGDISDARTILNLTNVNDIMQMCLESNVEDMSMHTITMENGSNNNIYTQHAFSSSKIKKLPTGFVESLSRGFKNLRAGGMFSNSRNFEIDISKINIPTLGSSPSSYDLDYMYRYSSCRHINRSIISRNNDDEISANEMYKTTTLIEDTPLPNDMFKNYKNARNMFEDTTFETADTLKYIYSEFAKGADFGETVSKSDIPFGNITVKNDIENAQITIPPTKEDYTKTKLVPIVFSEQLSNKMINLSIAGRRTHKNRNMALTAIGPACRELSFGSSLEDLKRASVREVGEFLPYYIDAGMDFKNFKGSYYVGDSTVTEFFFVNPRPMDITVFRKLALLMHGNDYFNMYNYLFEGAFMDRGNILGLRDDHTLTSILFSGTRENVDMLSLDEIKKPGFLTPIMTRKFDNACAIVNTNGKNLKWTLSRWHYSKLTADNGFRTSYGVHKFYNFISVFTDAVYLLRAIKTQAYFTKIFNNGKIEFVFRARNYTELKKFLAVMSVYLGPDDYDKPVGRYLLIYDNNLYDSKTDSSAINGLAPSLEITEYVNKINNGTIDNYPYAASYTPGER